jgi:drug/metabolite transporter (DMT)-like permease
VRPETRVLLAGCLFASGGALLKCCDFPALQRAGLRAAVAALAVFALLPEARRWPNARILRLLPAYFGATCLFVVANALTTAANAIFLQSTAPLWLALLSPLLLREPPSRRDLVTLVAIGVGMTLCCLAPTAAVATAPNPTLGNLMALGSGVSFAALLLGMRRLGQQAPGEACAAIAWGNAATFPTAFALLPVVGQTPIAGSAGDWLTILVLGVFQVGAAYALLVRAMPRVPAVRASLLLMVEPALNPLLAYAVHGETPHGLVVLGGALILGTTLLSSLLGTLPRRRGREPSAP